MLTARARRRRNAGVTAASALIHLALLAVVASQAPMLRIPPEEAGPPDTLIPIVMVPRPPSPMAAKTPEPLRLHRQAQPLPSPLQAPSAQPSQPAAPGPVAIHPAPLPEGPKGEVRAALRTGLTGCANRDVVGLNRAERGACDERLGTGAKTARYIPAPIDPGIRAYYDAVAKAKAPDGPLTPQSVRGRAGMFEDVAVGMKGHGPGFGCHLRFGGGKTEAAHPAHGLKLGPLPCFLVPPAGSLTPDVDVQNPDAVLRHSPDPK